MKVVESTYGRFEKDGRRYRIEQEEGDTQLSRVWASENGYALVSKERILFERKVVNKKNEIAAARYNAEFGGFTDAQTGMFVQTDNRTRTLIALAVTEARVNPAYTVPNWKTVDGAFIALDAPTIIALHQSMDSFIAAQFNKEASLSEQIDSAETIEAVDAITWA